MGRNISGLITLNTLTLLIPSAEIALGRVWETYAIGLAPVCITPILAKVAQRRERQANASGILR